MKYILVLCTINSLDSAKQISRKLVEEKLVSCVNIVPNMTSIYSWNNEIVEDSEFLLLMKTKEDLFSELKQRIVQLHEYEVPEIVCFDIKDGLESYLNWIKDETK